MTERSRKKEALEVKLELNNRSAVIISTVFILLNTAVWIKFFFSIIPIMVPLICCGRYQSA